MLFRSLLRRSEDIHCLLFHGITLFGYGCAFFLYLNPHYAGIEGPWSQAAFVLAASLMLAWCCGLDVPVNFHNHAHKPLFRSAWLNRWCGRLWTFSSGWPSFFFEHVHVTVHHGNLLEHDDWTLPHRRPDGRFESLMHYTFAHWPWRFAYHFYRDFTSDRYPPGTGRKALWELFIFLLLWSIPFCIDVEMALLLWLFPQWLGNILISGAGMYAQHAGCIRPTDQHPHSHSNSSLSPFHNLTMFNLGYHLAHHTYPRVHWTDLPRVHDHLMDKVQSRDPRLFAVSYYKMGNLLTTSGITPEELDRGMVRVAQSSNQPVPTEFELATVQDYRVWRGFESTSGEARTPGEGRPPGQARTDGEARSPSDHSLSLQRADEVVDARKG